MKKNKKNKKPDIEQSQLQDLLNRHVKTISEEAVQTEGQISSSQLETLERIARIVELHSIAQSPPPRVRWPVVMLLVTTLVIVSILLFAHVSTTEIELELSLSEVNFRLPQQQVLSDAMRVSALGVSGLQDIQFPHIGSHTPRIFHPSDRNSSAIRLSTASEAKKQSEITLASLSLPASAHVWVRSTEIPQQYRLSIKDAELMLRVDVNGMIEIGMPGTTTEEVNILTPKSERLSTLIATQVMLGQITNTHLFYIIIRRVGVCFLIVISVA